MQDSSKKIKHFKILKIITTFKLKTTGMSMGSEPGGVSEIVGIVVAFIVLLITFGSLIAAGMPIISAILGFSNKCRYDFITYIYV